MGSQTSKKNIVADSRTEDDSESYYLVNIHAPTVNLGISIVFGLVVAVGLYRLYNYFRTRKVVQAWGSKGAEDPGPAIHRLCGHDGPC